MSQARKLRRAAMHLLFCLVLWLVMLSFGGCAGFEQSYSLSVSDGKSTLSTALTLRPRLPRGYAK